METVCYLVRPCTGGMQKHVQEMIKYFSRQYRVVLVAPKGSLIASETKQNGITVYELPLAENISPGKDLYALRGLLSVLKKERPGLLHVHGFKVSLWGRLAGRIMGIPVIVTVHNFPAYPVNKTFLPGIFRTVEKVQGDWAYRYIAVSESIGEYLKKNSAIPAEKINVIYNGINTAPFEQAVRGDRSSPKNCLDFIKKEGIALAGTVARLAPQKGLKHFIQAAGILAPLFPNLRFVIVGDGPMREFLENLVQKTGLGGRVFFAGYLNDLPSVMSMLDIFVLPSYTEGLSITVLEALAAARPVVASRTGGVPEIIIHNKTGKLVTPGDSGALADAVEQLLLNPEDAKKMAEAGQERVKSLFTEEEMLKRTGLIYEELVGSGDRLEVSSVK